MKINRQDEAEFPDFDTLDEARKYFKNRFGNDYIIAENAVRLDEDSICYFDRIGSQSVEIIESDGKIYIHVVY